MLQSPFFLAQSMEFRQDHSIFCLVSTAEPANIVEFINYLMTEIHDGFVIRHNWEYPINEILNASSAS